MACNNRCETTKVRGVLSWYAAFGIALLAATSATRVSAQESEGGGMHQPGAFFDSSPQTRPMMVSALAGIHYGYYAAPGFPLTLAGRFYIPLVPNGFLPSINDEFGIEPGFDLNLAFGDNSVVGFGVPVDAVWDFHITPNFDAYGKLGFVFGNTFSDFGYGGFWWTVRSAVGLRLKMSDAVYFRAEVGWPAILAGFGFAL